MNKHILIIEDDFYIRDIYTRIFTQNGYLVESAEDGQIGMDKGQGTNYDMILLDIMLPKVTGIDILKTIRQSQGPNAHTPIFLITNLGQEDVIKEAFSLGADGYLIKSQLNPQDVVSEVETYFSQEEKNRNTATAKTPTGSS